jgi:hypothetical protein
MNPSACKLILPVTLALLATTALAQSPPVGGPPPDGRGPPPGFDSKQAPNGAYNKPSGASTRRDPARLPNFSGVWIRAEGMTHPDQTKILPFMTAAAAADWKQKIERKDFRVPWSNCEPTAFPALLTEFGLPIEFLMTPGRVTLLTPDGQTHSIYTDGSQHAAASAAGSYYGNSVGHWEGQTLVAETTDLRPDNNVVMGLMADTDKMVVVEHLTLVSADRIRDDITVTGPVYLAKPYQYTQYFKRMPNIRVGEFVCVASKNRNTGDSVDLTPPKFD